MKTSAAIAKRKLQIRERDRESLSHIAEARALGAKNARQIAKFLNANCVSAPTNDTWTQSAALRCLGRLKLLGLDRGSLLAKDARAKQYVRRGKFKIFRIAKTTVSKAAPESLATIAQRDVENDK